MLNITTAIKQATRINISLLLITSAIMGCSSSKLIQQHLPTGIEYNKTTGDFVYCESCNKPTPKEKDLEISLPVPTIINTPIAQNERLTLHFPFSKAYLTKADKQSLKHFYNSKLQGKTNLKVKIIGYTDNIEGAKGYKNINKHLSNSRAAVTKNYLISLGVGKNNIQTEAKPLCCYVSSNKTKNGRAQNRRAEVEVVISN